MAYVIASIRTNACSFMVERNSSFGWTEQELILPPNREDSKYALLVLWVCGGNSVSMQRVVY